MVKASMIACLIVASVVAARAVAADPIEFEEDEEYWTGFDLGDGEFYDGLGIAGIDLANQVTKPPQVECTLTCNQVESNAQLVCSVLGTLGRRVGCSAAVGAAGAVCRYYCSTR